MRKLINVVRAWYGYFIALVFGEVRLSLPYSLSIEPTNRCNLRCLECPSGRGMLERDRGNMGFDAFKRIIDDVRRQILSLTLYFQGEPFLNEECVRMIEYARGMGLWVETSTNAHFINDENAVRIVESGLNRIIVSLDGIDQQSYEQYRVGGNFERAVNGIRALVEAKRNSMRSDRLGIFRSKLKIVLQFIVFKYNEGQIENIKRLGRELGVDKVELKSAQICDNKHIDLLLTSIPRYARYRVVNGDLKRKGRFGSVCSRIFTNVVITWDGFVVPCCYDKDAEHRLGNVLQASYKDVMLGKKRREFIDRVIRHRESMDMCSECMY